MNIWTKIAEFFSWGGDEKEIALPVKQRGRPKGKKNKVGIQVTANQAAVLVNVSTDTIANWRKAGKITRINKTIPMKFWAEDVKRVAAMTVRCQLASQRRERRRRSFLLVKEVVVKPPTFTPDYYISAVTNEQEQSPSAS